MTTRSIILEYLEARVLLSALPGDANNDGRVDLTDLTVLAAHWQQQATLVQGDINGDGHVDLTDLTVMASHWQWQIGTDAYPANPPDGGTYTVNSGATLEGFDGRVTASDFVQERYADCWLVAEAAAHPSEVAQAVESDGTGYMVVFHNGTGITRVHVSAELPTWFSPVNGSIIGGIYEKAWAYYRYGTNTYVSLNYGRPIEVTNSLGIPASTYTVNSVSSASAWLSAKFSSGVPMCVLTTTTATALVSNHVYTVSNVSTINGVTWVSLRNPWGFQDATVTVTTLLNQAPWIAYDL